MAIIITILAVALMNILFTTLLYKTLIKFINKQTAFLSEKMSKQNRYMNPLLEKITLDIRKIQKLGENGYYEFVDFQQRYLDSL
jgi:hypothetical protein